ncbi:MAG: hypothetical protein COA67_10530 [Lutibacter sp.]|nr:MAG: hypothetical protein COA67_10530 [Lutibacter sp.]
MKKIYLLLSLLLINLTVFAQQPYYNDINTELTTLTGIPLRDALATKITNTHTNTLSYNDAREALKVIDLDPGQTNNVLLIYGFSNNTCPTSTSDDNDHRLRSKNSFGGGATCEWNREHVYAQSQGTPPLGQAGPGADAHHLRASDVQRNGQRSNLHFANGSGNSGGSGGGWYPGDEWKGDVARIIMYMYVRYGNQCLPSGITIGGSNTVDSNMIDLLLDWNAADQVSGYEDVRNTYLENLSNTYGQGNRNPFIDNPRLATRIWGGTLAQDRWGIYGGGDTQAPTVPANLSVSGETSSAIDLDWDASTDDTAVTGYDIYVGGIFNSSSATNSHTVTGLTASTTFSFTVLAKDAANNMSAQSSSVNGTTLAGSSGGSDLFFSEYVEGGGNNKVLEIVNITGSTVDLSTYTIKKSVNGSASWDSTIYSFPASAQVINEDVYVVANSSVASPCSISPDDSTGSSVLQFNGNDPVGLFNNDILIDIVGTLGGGSSNFAKNKTLIRKSSINGPSTTFNIADWDSFSQDDCSDIGTHFVVLSVDQNKLLSEIKIYPNPTNGNDLNISENQDLSIEIFNVLGKLVLTDNVSTNKTKIDVNTLNTGIYLIRLSSEDGSITRKFIKQ